MHEIILQILERIKPGVDFNIEKDLVEDRILESMEILQVASDLSDEFDIEITLPYIKPENFKSLETICAMVMVIMDEE